jgi:hypothetical protein
MMARLLLLAAGAGRAEEFLIDDAVGVTLIVCSNVGSDGDVFVSRLYCITCH